MNGSELHFELFVFIVVTGNGGQATLHVATPPNKESADLWAGQLTDYRVIDIGELGSVTVYFDADDMKNKGVRFTDLPRFAIRQLHSQPFVWTIEKGVVLITIHDLFLIFGVAQEKYDIFPYDDDDDDDKQLGIAFDT